MIAIVQLLAAAGFVFWVCLFFFFCELPPPFYPCPQSQYLGQSSCPSCAAVWDFSKVAIDFGCPTWDTSRGPDVPDSRCLAFGKSAVSIKLHKPSKAEAAGTNRNFWKSGPGGYWIEASGLFHFPNRTSTARKAGDSPPLTHWWDWAWTGRIRKAVQSLWLTPCCSSVEAANKSCLTKMWLCLFFVPSACSYSPVCFYIRISHRDGPESKNVRSGAKHSPNLSAGAFCLAVHACVCVLMSDLGFKLCLDQDH